MSTVLIYDRPMDIPWDARQPEAEIDDDGTVSVRWIGEDRSAMLTISVMPSGKVYVTRTETRK